MRFLLVVPAGAASLESGGGQRSAIFYKAMAGIAPTDVLLLSNRDEVVRDHPAFPDASVRLFDVEGYAPRPGNPLRRMAGDIRKLWRIERLYRPSPAAAAAVARMGGVEGYDLAVFRFFQAATSCMGAFPASTRLALDLDDRDDQKYAATLARRFGTGPHVRWLSNRVERRIRAIFAAELPHLSQIWTVESADRVAQVDVPMDVVPNVPYFRPQHEPSPPSTGQGLVFVGTAGHPPNVNGLIWFLKEAWPLVRAEVPEARLSVVGSGGWTPARLDGADLSAVDIVGRVASVDDAYLGARASISPIFDGGGSKIKVIESCAFARPAVCSPHSRRGFAGPLADALPVGDDASSFARRCIELLVDPSRADELGARLLAAQRGSFSEESAVARIRSGIENILAGPDRGQHEARSRA